MTSTKVYKFQLVQISKNPHFEDNVHLMDKDGLRNETLRSCLIGDNGSKKSTKQALRYVKQKRVMVDNYEDIFFLQTQSKWGMTFLGDVIDKETGELTRNEVYQVTDLEQSTKRKRKAIKTFSDFYEPLYQSKKVSCMFLTLTQANQSNEKLNVTLKAIKKRFERHNLPILGYLWVSEVSKNGHWHYHLAIVTKRVRWKQIPKWAKIDDLWGRRTQIEFIRKSIGAYLGKYIGKDNIGRIMNFRQYGKSRNFIGV